MGSSVPALQLRVALVVIAFGTGSKIVFGAAVLSFAAGLLSRYGREALAFTATALGVAGSVVAVFTAHGSVVLRSTLNPAWSLTMSGAAAQSLEVFERLRGVGIDLSDVFAVLENDGVAKFTESWLRSTKC